MKVQIACNIHQLTWLVNVDFVAQSRPARQLIYLTIGGLFRLDHHKKPVGLNCSTQRTNLAVSRATTLHSSSNALVALSNQSPEHQNWSIYSLCNRVLFLDELPEFKRNVLEVMRQPLEDGSITVSRAMGSINYPASFMLVAAMNPCPCGFFTDPQKECTCTPMQIQRYRSKVSGPLLDRIDIQVEVPTLRYQELASKDAGEPSSEIRQRVNTARVIQLERFDKRPIHANAQMGARDLKRHCAVNSDAEKLLEHAINKLGLSARAYSRVLKVSRTIADLEGSEEIRSSHIAEAIQYRSLDRRM